MNPNKEQGNIESQDNDHIYYSMNMPNWFINEPVENKCRIVENLNKELKNKEPITAQQKTELFSIK